MQHHRRLAARVTAELPVHPVPVAHVERAGLVRLDVRVHGYSVAGGAGVAPKTQGAKMTIQPSGSAKATDPRRAQYGFDSVTTHQPNLEALGEVIAACRGADAPESSERAAGNSGTQEGP